MKKFSFYKTRIQLITASLFKNIWSTLAQKNSKIKKKKKKFWALVYIFNSILNRVFF